MDFTSTFSFVLPFRWLCFYWSEFFTGKLLNRLNITILVKFSGSTACRTVDYSAEKVDVADINVEKF